MSPLPLSLAITCALVVYGLAWLAWRARVGSALDRLARLAKRLGGSVDRRTGTAAGAYRGLAIAHRLMADGAEPQARTWTEIECLAPPAPVTIHVRRHGVGDRGRIARGEMVDLELGDRRFDALFRVEAAPADVVRRALGGRMRAYLVAHPGATLETVDGALRLTLPHWVTGYVEAITAWNALVDLERGLRETTPALAGAAPLEGAPFRTSAAAQREMVREARAEEVAWVERLRAGRRSDRAMPASQLAVLVVLVLATIAMLAAMVLS